MRTNKRAQLGLIAKAAFFVIMVAVVIAVVYNLYSSSKKMALDLAGQQLSQYEQTLGSLVHPDLDPQLQYFWQTEFMDFIKKGLSTEGLSTSDGKGDRGVFFMDENSKAKLNGYSITFKQEDSDNYKGISFQLSDSRGVIAALYPTPLERETTPLKDKILCIKNKPDSKSSGVFDVSQITIKFGDNAQSLYYTKEQLASKGTSFTSFYYLPFNFQYLNSARMFSNWVWLVPVDQYNYLFFYKFNPTEKRFCLVPINPQKGPSNPNSYNFDDIKAELSNAYPDFNDFLSAPDSYKGVKECLFTSCTDFNGVGDTMTRCADFAKTCPNRCFYSSKKWFGASVAELCSSCQAVSSCSDYNAEDCKNIIATCPDKGCKLAGDNCIVK